LAPHAGNYFYQKSIKDIQQGDFLRAKINYEKSLFLSDEFANPNTTGFIQVYLAYARDLSNKAQQDSKISASRYLNQAIRAYERVLSFNPPPDLVEAINAGLADSYYSCASKQVSCKYESDIVANYQKAMDYYNKLGEHEESGCIGLSLDKTSITHIGVDSPAQKAGIQVYDKILSIDGIPVNSSQEIVNLGRSKVAGTLVTLSVYRKKYGGYGEFAFQFPRISWKRCFIHNVESGIASFHFATFYKDWKATRTLEDADYHLNEAIRHNPTNFIYYILLALHHEYKEFPQNETLAEINKGIERFQWAELYETRGDFYCEWGKKEEAIIDYKKAISLWSKTDEEGKKTIENLEIKLKDLQCPLPT